LNKSIPTFRDFWNKNYAVSCFPPTWYIFQRLGAILAFTGFRFGISPNGMTALGGVLGFITIWLFGTLPNDNISSIQLAIMFAIVYSFDCSDGQLARATGKTSDWGKWFDLTIDLLLIILFPLGIVFFLHGIFSVLQLSGLILILTFGRALALLTSAIKRTDGENHTPSNSILKKVFQSIVDTPTFYVILCLFRVQPDWLFYTSMAYGLLFVFVGIYFSKSFIK
jgi:phosphatidylglycerophosphate synthase